ncbi:cytochrome C biogenesis protein CcdA [Vibrio panuliri]|uniref:Cytochrome C biogenesis protein CcdA n=1 Tax=Vibrio panuliri TaxID=1381081 RepID=A0A1Q9H9T7_9VIBR|nr:SPOR domain-containing protein [Vibrio panuliri]OLQ85853.1 cytochrome C biogenesis protein CcdA [Vibrio panuliri]
MKKIAIVGLSVLLSACVSSQYTTDVSSESYREDYKVAQVEQPVTETVVEEVVVTPAQNKPAVTIIPPSNKQQNAQMARYGYTIQVVAVGSQTKVDHFARQLPNNGQPIWENYKVVNGTKWYTVLYGDYATQADAKKAISRLPSEFQALKPFVKSIDTIKNSPYPTLNKLN